MPDVQMDYDAMETMSRMFSDASGQMEDLVRWAQQMAAQAEGGALIGDAGDEFGDSMRGKLIPSLNRLRDKLDELSMDIMGAVIYMRDGVADARSRFL